MTTTKKQKKKLLILGGTKYVGLELLKTINNYDIYVLSRKPISINNIKFIQIDRKNKEELKKQISNINPEIILDMICYDKQDAQEMISIIEDLHSLTHYIIISSFFIYNYSSKYEEFEELDINIIEDNYTKNKYEAEKVIYKSKVFSKTSIVRFPFIFSKDDYSKRFQYLTQQSKIKVIDNLKCSFISKDNAVDALSLLLTHPPLGFVDISNKNSITLKEIYTIWGNIKNTEFKFVETARDIYQIKKDISLNSKYEDLFSLPSCHSAFKSEFIKYTLKI